MPSLDDDDDAKATKQDGGEIPPIVQRVRPSRRSLARRSPRREAQSAGPPPP